MIRILTWHDVPRQARRVGFGLAAAAALLVVLAAAGLLLGALALHVAQAGGL